jgi:hypothetical protein
LDAALSLRFQAIQCCYISFEVSVNTGKEMGIT